MYRERQPEAGHYLGGETTREPATEPFSSVVYLELDVSRCPSQKTFGSQNALMTRFSRRNPSHRVVRRVVSVISLFALQACDFYTCSVSIRTAKIDPGPPPGDTVRGRSADRPQGEPTQGWAVFIHTAFPSSHHPNDNTSPFVSGRYSLLLSYLFNH